jgi:hypothetical protein
MMSRSAAAGSDAPCGQFEEFDRHAELAYARCLHDSLPFFLPIFSREDPGVAAGDRAGRQ